MTLSPLQQIVLDVVRAFPDGVSLDEIARGFVSTGKRSHSADRATARAVLRRLGAEGLVESGDGGESWRRVEG